MKTWIWILICIVTNISIMILTLNIGFEKTVILLLTVIFLNTFILILNKPIPHYEIKITTNADPEKITNMLIDKLKDKKQIGTNMKTKNKCNWKLTLANQIDRDREGTEINGEKYFIYTTDCDDHYIKFHESLVKLTICPKCKKEIKK